jgi:hypothetical protein
VLGTLLDESRITSAAIVLSPTGAKVTGPGWSGRREWFLLALQVEHARRRSWRGRQTPRGPQLHWSHRLRLIGCELDAVGAHTYALVVQPQAVRVKSPTGYDRSFNSDSQGRRALLAPHLRGQQPDSGEHADSSPPPAGAANTSR